MNSPLDSPQPRDRPPFHLRPTSPATQAAYERVRDSLAAAYRAWQQEEQAKGQKGER